jgi:hypothetical protein
VRRTDIHLPSFLVGIMIGVTGWLLLGEMTLRAIVRLIDRDRPT